MKTAQIVGKCKFTYHFDYDEDLDGTRGVILTKITSGENEYSVYDEAFDALIPWKEAEDTLIWNSHGTGS